MVAYGLTPGAQAEVDVLANKADTLGEDIAFLKTSLANVEGGLQAMRAEGAETRQALVANSDLMRDVRRMLEGRGGAANGPAIIERYPPPPCCPTSTTGNIATWSPDVGHAGDPPGTCDDRVWYYRRPKSWGGPNGIHDWHPKWQCPA